MYKSWEELAKAGFVWEKFPRDVPDPRDPFPPKYPDRRFITEVAIKHESWTCWINLNIKRELGETPLDIDQKRFKLFNKFSHLRNVSFEDIARYLIKGEHVR